MRADGHPAPRRGDHAATEIRLSRPAANTVMVVTWLRRRHVRDGGEHGRGAERSQQLPDARLDAAKV